MSRILIVEDEPDIALGLEDDLKLEGHEVEVVGDGETAYRRGREPSWDLILLDVMLPRKDGFDVCRELKMTPAGKYVPVVVLTSPRKGLQQELLMARCDAHVTKPYSDDALRTTVVRLVGAPAEAIPTPVAKLRIASGG